MCAHIVAIRHLIIVGGGGWVVVLRLLECVLSSSSSGRWSRAGSLLSKAPDPINTHRLDGLGNLQHHVTHQKLAKWLLPRTAHGARGPKTLEHPPVHVSGPSVPGGLASARSGRQAWGPRRARVSGWGGGWWRPGAGGCCGIATPPSWGPARRGRVH